jgi:hypothetical protein
MQSALTAVLQSVLEPRIRDFYLRAMDVLDAAGVRYLVGGAYALAHHAGIVRHTKDLDLFITRDDFDRAAGALRGAGYRTDLIFPHWLGKAFHGEAFVDLIFGSGNGLCNVDEQWFAHAVRGDVLGRRAPLCAAEEIVWTKAFIQERERFDGADIAHVILARGRELDWARLVRRFAAGGHERVLLGHVIFFGYIYPAHRTSVPRCVVEQLMQAVRDELERDERADDALADDDPAGDAPLCRGTLLSRQQYLTDIHQRGHLDARHVAHGGNLTDDDIQRWTAAIDTAK